MNLLRLLLYAAVTGLCLSGCSSDSEPAVVKLAVTTSGSLPSGNLSGIGMTITLPAGVTPPLDATGQVDSSHLVTASGVTVAGGLAATAIHTTGQPVQLSVVVASKAAAGFGTGETMVLTLNRSKGVTPGAGDFTVKEFRAVDLNDTEVKALTALLTIR